MTKDRDASARVARYHARLKGAGLVRVSVWVPKDKVDWVHQYAKELKDPNMFHTYVLNYERVLIDIDRARYLMSDDLWQEVVDECAATGRKDPQSMWSNYCNKHYDKFGEDFAPNTRKNPL